MVTIPDDGHAFLRRVRTHVWRGKLDEVRLHPRVAHRYAVDLDEGKDDAPADDQLVDVVEYELVDRGLGAHLLHRR